MNITVAENDPNPEVCVVLEGAISDNLNVRVTLETGPKNDAVDQATGNIQRRIISVAVL